MATIVDELILAYINERNTSTLLPYNNTVIESMKRILAAQNEIISKVSLKLKILYEAEYERLSFFATQYLKTRLDKLKNGRYDERHVSLYEKRFYEKFTDLTKKYDFYAEESCEYVEYVCFMVVIDGKSLVIDGNRVEMKYGDVFITEIGDVKEMLIHNEIILF